MDTSIGNCSRIISFYFLIVIVAGLLQNSDAVACRYCNKDFKKVGSHSYRCTARITSPRPLSQHRESGPPEPNEMHRSQPATPTSSSSSSAAAATAAINLLGHPEIKCTCGQGCKGKRGLRAHQRFCKHATNSSETAPDSEPNEDAPTDLDTVGVQDQNIGESAYANLKYKPGLKRPTNKEDWNMTNSYFHSIIHVDIKFINESDNLDQLVLVVVVVVTDTCIAPLSDMDPQRRC